MGEREGRDRSEGGECGAVRRRHTFFWGFRLAACAAGLLPAASRLAPLLTLIVTRRGCREGRLGGGGGVRARGGKP
jgi:hypothetical protein